MAWTEKNVPLVWHIEAIDAIGAIDTIEAFDAIDAFLQAQDKLQNISTDSSTLRICRELRLHDTKFRYTDASAWQNSNLNC